jgi:endonuclease/exonuclease/phosphatase family metal-dependent hydrolase
MPQLKIATFNIEWMISVFGGAAANWNGEIPASFPGKSLGQIRLARIDDVPALCQRIKGVIERVDPDILGVQEGPPLKAQMELFARRFLGDRYAVFQSNAKNQSVFALVRRSLAANTTQIGPADPALAPLNTPFFYYPWQGFRVEDRKRHRFDRLPLALDIVPAPGLKLHLVVVHTKSKFSKLKRRQQWEVREKEAVLDALDSRQKLSAEVAQLRRYVSRQVAPPSANRNLVLIGDFNDGPLSDELEHEFLLHNIVDELAGSFLAPESYLTHAMAPAVLDRAVTVRFPDPFLDDEVVGECIDHILVAPALLSGDAGLRLRAGSCVVESAAYDAFNDDAGDSDRGLRPSDHRPVSAVVEF